MDELLDSAVKEPSEKARAVSLLRHELEGPNLVVPIEEDLHALAVDPYKDLPRNVLLFGGPPYPEDLVRHGAFQRDHLDPSRVCHDGDNRDAGRGMLHRRGGVAERAEARAAGLRGVSQGGGEGGWATLCWEREGIKGEGGYVVLGEGGDTTLKFCISNG